MERSSCGDRAAQIEIRAETVARLGPVALDAKLFTEEIVALLVGLQKYV
jgi:hypothetical protein